MFGLSLPPSSTPPNPDEAVEIIQPYVSKYPEEEPDEAKTTSGCRKLEELNLTGCRGVPVGLRRRWFDAVELGEV